MNAVRLVILAHRYIGIPMSLLFVIWFVSGVTMMYTRGMPETDTTDRPCLQPILPIELIRIGPREAAAAAGIRQSPGAVSIVGLLGRPAYVFGNPDSGSNAVFADDGELFTGATASDGTHVLAAALGLPTEDIRYIATLDEADQWTLTQQRHLPLLRFDIDDGKGTTAYVSAQRAEVVLVIDRRDRWLAWLGAIPHWLYFTPLRSNRPAWYWTIIALSVAGCIVALLGLILAYTQFRRSTPFRLGDSIRYRGWMRWHYYSGAVFGVFILTWIFSGLLSMEPFGWTQRSGLSVPADIMSGGEPNLAVFDRLADASAAPPFPKAIRRLDLLQVQGRPHIAIHSDEYAGPVLYDLTNSEYRGADFELDEIVRWLDAALPANIAAADLLRDYDAYYYDRDGILPLPVARIKLDDPDETWLYVDPSLNRIQLETNRLARLERWLFNGMHSLDFGFWFDKRPLWDIVMITLSLGGLAGSLIGMMLGLKRLSGQRGR